MNSSLPFSNKLVVMQRLFAALDQGEVLSWESSGESFVVYNGKQVTKVLVSGQKAKFESFIRVLNYLGIKRTKLQDDEEIQKFCDRMNMTRTEELKFWKITHPFIVRGKPELLNNLRTLFMSRIQKEAKERKRHSFKSGVRDMQTQTESICTCLRSELISPEDSEAHEYFKTLTEFQ
jgi:hypothetical protein